MNPYFRKAHVDSFPHPLLSFGFGPFSFRFGAPVPFWISFPAFGLFLLFTCLLVSPLFESLESLFLLLKLVSCVDHVTTTSTFSALA